MSDKYQKVVDMEEKYSWYDWYQFGRKADEDQVTDVLIFTDKNEIKKAVLSGAVRENRFDILEYYLYTEPHFHFHACNVEIVSFVNTKRMVDFLDEHKGWIQTNFHRYPYLVGKCRVQPLSKLKKQIDGFEKDQDNQEWIIDCLKASAENKNTEVFRYLYNKFIEMELFYIIYPKEIISEAIERGDFVLVERMLSFISEKDFDKLSYSDQIKIKQYISKNEKRNILLFEKIAGTNKSLIPKDVTKYIINSFIYPTF